MIYQVEYVQTQSSGTIPVEAKSRQDAVRIVKGRLGPGTVAVVTGIRE